MCQHRHNSITRLKEIKPPSLSTRKRWQNCKAILPAKAVLPAKFDARRQPKSKIKRATRLVQPNYYNLFDWTIQTSEERTEKEQEQNNLSVLVPTWMCEALLHLMLSKCRNWLYSSVCSMMEIFEQRDTLWYFVLHLEEFLKLENSCPKVCLWADEKLFSLPNICFRHLGL